MEDPHLSPVLQRAAIFESYEHVDNRWLAWVIEESGTGRHVSTTVSAVRAELGLGTAPLLKPGLPPEMAVLHERTWWPAKLTDSALPHFAVAIQPRWSAGLFGVPLILTERPDELAIGREQVYYRSGRNSTLRAPGRILWFLSQEDTVKRARGRGSSPASYFIGTSLLDMVETGTPEELHAALRQYGVFELAQIRGVADDRGLVQALHFSDTELFRSHVSWAKYTSLLETFEGPKQIQAPASMPVETFAAIYALGFPDTPE